MKKMNKMYQAPKAEVVELNVNSGFMNNGNWNGASVPEIQEPELPMPN
ncbi:MAG: hypothetical protein IJK78_02335 [Bacteroidales bacterium]|nr:hypothetical protein [Bacteroidales bacterium]